MFALCFLLGFGDFKVSCLLVRALDTILHGGGIGRLAFVALSRGLFTQHILHLVDHSLPALVSRMSLDHVGLVLLFLLASSEEVKIHGFPLV